MTVASLLLLFPTHDSIAKHVNNTSVAIVASAPPSDVVQKELTIQDRISNILKPSDISNGVKKGNLYIPKDTKIVLELQNDVSSKRNKLGDTFNLKTIDNLLVNDVVAIPKDTVVRGVVLKSKRNGLFGRGGHLEVDSPSIRTINNIDVPLNGYINGYGSDDNGAVVVAAAVTLVGGFFMKGENIYYDKNQLIEVAVRDDTDINATPETLLTVMDPTVPQGQGLVVKPR